MKTSRAAGQRERPNDAEDAVGMEDDLDGDVLTASARPSAQIKNGRPALAGNDSSRSVSLMPVKTEWQQRVVALTCLAVLAFTSSSLWPPGRQWTQPAGIACIVALVVQAVHGWRHNRREEIAIYAVNQLRFTTSIPVIALGLRWSRRWIGTPVRFRLRYPEYLALASKGDLVATELLAAARTLWPDYAWRTTRHQVRCAQITLVTVEEKQTREQSALNLSRARVRDIVGKLFDQGFTISDITADDDTVTGFTVSYGIDVAAKVSNPAIADRVVRIISAVLPGRWRADFRIVEDLVVFEQRPVMPTMLPRPVLDCRPDGPNYYLLPQSVDEDGNVQNWDVSGVRAHFLKVGRTRSGKALEISTNIATPSGWTTMGALKVGDLVFDEQGHPTTVLGVFDQPTGRTCFEVVFSDGSTIVADAEHLWWTEDRPARVSRCAATFHQDLRSRVPTLAPEARNRLRKAAEAADPGDTITLNQAAELIDGELATPWLRTVARKVGPVGEKPNPLQFTYAAQTVTQQQLVHHYPAHSAYSELATRARSDRYPTMQPHLAALTQLEKQEGCEEVTPLDLAKQLGVPYWKAARWLKRLGVAGRRARVGVTLHVPARQLVRNGRPILTYPTKLLLEALADKGERYVRDQRHNASSGAVRTTSEIAATVIAVGGGHLNHSIPVSRPLDLPEIQLPIPPYTLGVWLGDGSSWGGLIFSADPDIIDFVRADGFIVRQHKLARDPDQLCRTYGVSGLRTALAPLGLIKRSKDQPPTKRVPPQYLRSSIGQRRVLLAGLLDTDGTVSPRGSVQFTTTVAQLGVDVLELARSLGYRATSREGRAKLDGRDCGPKWTVAFTTADPVFRLPRKVATLAARTAHHNPERVGHRYICQVRPVPEVPMRCITVDSPTHLFLAGEAMIPTHNTVSLIGDAVEASRRGWRILVIDPKRIEFLGLRDWPNVQIVATQVIEQIAVIYYVLRLMEERYRAIEEDGVSETSFVRFLLVIDEYRQFYANVNAWWASIKESKMPAKCPVFEWIGSLLRMAGAAGIHVDLGTQRPDSAFLEGEVRDNFAGRSSKGRLSPQGAMMMYDDAQTGSSIPLTVRGRGTMVSDVDDIPREVQDFYTPDPRKAKSPEDLALLEALRPALDMVRWSRQQVQMDELVDEEGRTFSGAQMWAAILDAELVDRPDTPAEDSSADDVDSAVEEEADPYATEFEPARRVGAGDLRVGDLVDLGDGQWVEITSTGPADDLDGGATDGDLLLTWSDEDGEEGVIESNDEQTLSCRPRRPDESR